jgi:hypothetical protein
MMSAFQSPKLSRYKRHKMSKNIEVHTTIKTVQFLRHGLPMYCCFAGTTLSTKCSLLIGQSVDTDDISHHFNGIVDEVRGHVTLCLISSG